jgi:hypothetical protein
MTIYDRYPTFAGQIRKINNRLNALERRTRGGLKYYNTGISVPVTSSNTSSNPKNIRSLTFTSTGDNVIELWCAIRGSHGAASQDTIITSSIDGGTTQQILEFTNNAAVTRATTPGDKTGIGGLPSISGAQPGGFIVIGYSVDSGTHTIDINAYKASGSATFTLTEQYYALRQT